MFFFSKKMPKIWVLSLNFIFSLLQPFVTCPSHESQHIFDFVFQVLVTPPLRPCTVALRLPRWPSEKARRRCQNVKIRFESNAGIDILWVSGGIHIQMDQWMRKWLEWEDDVSMNSSCAFERLREALLTGEGGTMFLQQWLYSSRVVFWAILLSGSF